MGKTKNILNNEECAIFRGEYGDIFFGKIYRFMGIDGIIASLESNKMRFKNPFLLNDPFDLLNYNINWDEYLKGFKERQRENLIHKLIEWILKKIDLPEQKQKLLFKIVQEFNQDERFDVLKNRIMDAFTKILDGQFKDDGQFKYDMEKAFFEMKSIYKKQIKLCSFSRNYSMKNSPLMWAHYADSHKGACLEFTFGESFIKALFEDNQTLIDPSFIPHIVKYSNTLPSLSFQNDREAFKAFKFKQKAWEYEEELRLILGDNIESDHTDVDFPFNYLTKIIFGVNTQQSEIEKIGNIVQRNPMIQNVVYEKMSLTRNGELSPNVLTVSD